MKQRTAWVLRLFSSLIGGIIGGSIVYLVLHAMHVRTPL